MTSGKASDRSARRRAWRVQDYSLDLTLDSGQAFRWNRCRESRAGNGAAWEGVVAKRWVRLWRRGARLHAETTAPLRDWRWLEHFFQLKADLADRLATFPDDPPLQRAVVACPGLRLLRQEPWECLASFILSATKQIVQIRQIVATLCERFGRPLPVPKGHPPAFGFPAPERLATLDETDLRACRAGFRAPRLLAAARAVTEGRLRLDTLPQLPLDEARARLMALDGVGRKIADCVLLFAGGFEQVFPVDVWILRVLREEYFPRRRPKPAEVLRFSETHFGPHAGLAQQYLFHHRRTWGRAGQ